jgi:hypothetical protein
LDVKRHTERLEKERADIRTRDSNAEDEWTMRVGKT